MYIGPYDDEPATILQMNQYAKQHGCLPDLSVSRLHHEIYLSDPRRCAPQRLKTVIRQPVKKHNSFLKQRVPRECASRGAFFYITENTGFLYTKKKKRLEGSSISEEPFNRFENVQILRCVILYGAPLVTDTIVLSCVAVHTSVRQQINRSNSAS